MEKHFKLTYLNNEILKENKEIRDTLKVAGEILEENWEKIK